MKLNYTVEQLKNFIGFDGLTQRTQQKIYADCLELHKEVERLRAIVVSCAMSADSLEEHNRIIRELNDAEAAKGE